MRYKDINDIERTVIFITIILAKRDPKKIGEKTARNMLVMLVLLLMSVKCKQC